MKRDFFGYLEERYGIKLNGQQREAVLHKEGPAVTIAVPGSGKTTVLLCRTANMVINYGIKPSNILSVTYNRAAAMDMKDRFNNIFGKLIGDDIAFSTIHAFAFNIIKAANIRYKLIEGDKAEISKAQIIRKIYRDINNEYLTDDKFEELTKDISFIKNMMMTGREVSVYKSDIDNFTKIYERYESLKKNYNYIDFDDMLTISYEILNNNKRMLEMYRRQYPYIQVDEGQDTSKIQNALIKMLAEPKNNLFVVADDDQSIYGFRGAYPEALLNFKNEHEGAKLFFMEENFRSTKAIVSMANEFIKANKKRYTKNLFTSNNDENKAEIVELYSNLKQIEYIIKELEKSKDLSDTAILYRNNISAISLAEALSRKGIPFYLKENKLHFFKHTVTEDIKSFLRLAINAGDIEAFKRIYYKMNAYISKALVEIVEKELKGGSVFEVLKSNAEVYQRNKFSALEANFRYLAYKKPKEAIEYIESVLLYKQYLEEHSRDTGYSFDTLKNVLAHLKYIAGNSNSIVTFLARLDELQDIMDKSKFNKNKNTLTLSTIHSVKGLEYENVYMIDLIDGEFPTAISIEKMGKGDSSLLEEERRLFYVGLTRAKKNLKLLVTSCKDDEGIVMSRFAGEMFAILNPISEASILENEGLRNISKGVKVTHKKFGVGTIIDIDENVIKVAFKNYGIKRLAADICMDSDLMTINDDYIKG